MKFEWEKPDRSVVEISDPNPIIDVLNDLGSRIETAKARGRFTDEAALRSMYASQHSQWRWCMARYYQSQHHSLIRFVRDWELVLSWWTECAQGAGTEAISDPQRILLSDLSDELRPTTWEEARRILEHHRWFKIPPCGLHAAITRLSPLIPFAISVRDEAERLSRELFEGVSPDQGTLDEFQSRSDELKVQFDGLVAGR